MDKNGVMANVTGAAGFLTIAQAAAELSTKPLNVKRLIARGRIPAARLGVDGEWRLGLTNIGAYISRSAPDIAMPDNDGGWFTDGDGASYAALTFQTNLIKAAKKGLSMDSCWSTVRDIPLTAEMRQVANQGADTGHIPNRFTDAATAYFVHRIRLFARNLIKAPPSGKLSRLYDTPDAYDTFTRDAMKRLLTDGLVFQATFSEAVPHLGFGETFPAKNPKSETGRFRVSDSELLTPARQAAVLQSAF